MDENERILFKVGALYGWGIALCFLWPLLPLALVNAIVEEDRRRRDVRS